MKTILVASDGSGDARKAVQLAGELAGKYEAKLILVHILQLRGKAKDKDVDAVKPIIEKEIRLAKGKGAKEIETVTENGEPADRILKCAKREGADLIVMGSRGLGKVEKFLLGSVSLTVSQRSKCSCITVR
ncbi:MAG: universal stress protein [Rhodospirillales bacterium]|jgi:nucleotide-binding universal stress UspA family protein|nr:universal stress protein [Rhodospirillales bacterium]